MHTLPPRGEVENRIIALLVQHANEPIMPREAFETIASELNLSQKQMNRATWIKGDRRNAWQYLCEIVIEDLSLRGCLERRAGRMWALSDAAYAGLTSLQGALRAASIHFTDVMALAALINREKVGETSHPPAKIEKAQLIQIFPGNDGNP